MAAGGGVRVHPQDASLREQLPQFLLHLLGAGAHMLHDATALRTDLRSPLGVAAVVAHEPPVGGVVG